MADVNPMDEFRTAIAQLLCQSLPGLSFDKAYAAVDYGKRGEDFTAVLLRCGLNKDHAKEVIEDFAPNEFISSISRHEAFLHFKLNTATLIRKILDQVHCHGEEYGTSSIGKGKKVIIEYSSPNIAKSFHVGHLRSTIIGAFLANLYKACGWEVVSMNYLGDWGTQFGMIATGFEKYGSREELDKDAIKHLFDVYVKVNKDAEGDPNVKVEAAKWFKRMEDGDEDALKNWREWRELSVKKYEEEYERLNVMFDVYTGESEVGKQVMDEVVDKLSALNLIEDVDGAKLVNLEKWGMEKAILRKKDGTSIYLTRDIGAAIERQKNYNFDKMIYVVSSQQDLHLQQLFKILDLMGYEWAEKLEHVNYGLVQGMSTRKGTVVFLNEIIKEAANVMHGRMLENDKKYSAIEDPEATSQEIGITGIKIRDMSSKRINDYTFNWTRTLSFKGGTGPYLQYAHVRLASIGRKNPHLLPFPPRSQIDTSSLSQFSQARQIVFLLGTYPDVVKTALKTHEPSGVVTFAFRVADAISSALDVVIVMGEPDIEKARARMYLYECARDVLGNAMKLLSIRPLERM